MLGVGWMRRRHLAGENVCARELSGLHRRWGFQQNASHERPLTCREGSVWIQSVKKAACV